MKWELDQHHPAQSPSVEPTQPFPRNVPSGFVTFRYTSTEVFSQNGQVHMKMHETRFQDGRLSSQECEGTIARDAYQRMVNDAQAQFLNQMVGVARLLLGSFRR